MTSGTKVKITLVLGKEGVNRPASFQGTLMWDVEAGKRMVAISDDDQALSTSKVIEVVNRTGDSLVRTFNSTYKVESI